MALRVAFLERWIASNDPHWDDFVGRYREACELARGFEEKAEDDAGPASDLAEEIQELLGEDPRRIPACLLGRTIEDGQWWQYLKEIALKHPAAVLFVARELVGDDEILIPCHWSDSEVAQELGLLPPTQAPAQPSGSTV